MEDVDIFKVNDYHDDDDVHSLNLIVILMIGSECYDDQAHGLYAIFIDRFQRLNVRMIRFTV